MPPRSVGFNNGVRVSPSFNLHSKSSKEGKHEDKSSNSGSSSSGSSGHISNKSSKLPILREANEAELIVDGVLEDARKDKEQMSLFIATLQAKNDTLMKANHDWDNQCKLINVERLVLRDKTVEYLQQIHGLRKENEKLHHMISMLTRNSQDLVDRLHHLQQQQTQQTQQTQFTRTTGSSMGSIPQAPQPPQPSHPQSQSQSFVAPMAHSMTPLPGGIAHSEYNQSPPQGFVQQPHYQPPFQPPFSPPFQPPLYPPQSSMSTSISLTTPAPQTSQTPHHPAPPGSQWVLAPLAPSDPNSRSVGLSGVDGGQRGRAMFSGVTFNRTAKTKPKIKPDALPINTILIGQGTNKDRYFRCMEKGGEKTWVIVKPEEEVVLKRQFTPYPMRYESVGGETQICNTLHLPE
jgi:hypothetical protein